MYIQISIYRLTTDQQWVETDELPFCKQFPDQNLYMPFSAEQKSNLDETQLNWTWKRQKVMCCVTSEAAGEKSLTLKEKGHRNKKVAFSYTMRKYFSMSKRKNIFIYTERRKLVLLNAKNTIKSFIISQPQLDPNLLRCLHEYSFKLMPKFSILSSPCLS